MSGFTPLAQAKTSLLAVLPALTPVPLMLLWAVHDGGYDADTWYWGALLLLAVLTAFVVGGGVANLSRLTRLSLLAFGLYTTWSYASISWAQAPGDALEGSNRTLLYLLVFSLCVLIRWTPRQALNALVAFTLGIGALALTLLFRLARGDHIASLFSEGRLISPTGYFNSSAALFTIAALLGLALAVRKELRPLLRGALVGLACADLQLALLAQSRGWLFTAPIVVLLAIALVRDRLRVIAAATMAFAGAIASLPRLLDVFRAASSGSAYPTQPFIHAAERAADSALLATGGIFAAAVLLAAGDLRVTPARWLVDRKRMLGTAVAVLFVATATVSAVAATHGHPLRYVSRQWHGFTHNASGPSAGTHFAVVGSGRYDIWRVSLDAFLSHPLGGLGQDNFAPYYVRHRRTGQEPRWTHSIGLRLLAHTGLVGLGLFATFLIASLLAVRRRAPEPSPFVSAVAAAALLPLIVWLVHGSVDWFWEMPALAAPALGFLGIAASLAQHRSPAAVALPAARRSFRAVSWVLGAAAVVLAACVLGFPYLSVREVSIASDAQALSPATALHDYSVAADLNPLSANPGRMAGMVALGAGLFGEAERRFRQSMARDPGGWLSWLGDGLAASELGDRSRARHDFQVAYSINSRQPAIARALARVNSTRPLTPQQAFQLLVVTT